MHKTSLVSAAALAIAATLATAPAWALTINVATGQDGSGNIQTTGDSLDANWTASGGNNYLSYPNAYVVAPNNADWFGGWFANGLSSSWIAPDPDVSNNGNIILNYTFNLSSYNLSTIVTSGFQWAIDDQGSVSLNGYTLSSVGNGDWGSFTAFTIPAGDFVQGVNTLTIQGTNSDNYLEAARLEGTVVIDPIPEPVSTALLGAGLAALGLLRRKRG